MMLELILRAKAATYFNTSVTVLTDSLLLQYMEGRVRQHYPQLYTNNPTLYADLKQLHSLTDVNLYEWWFGTPVGPKSCSRDIADLRQALHYGKGDEWSEGLEQAVMEFQSQFHDPRLITGYACAETIRRLRL